MAFPDGSFFEILFRVVKGLNPDDIDKAAAVLKQIENVVKDDPTFEADLEVTVQSPTFQSWFQFVAKHARTVTVLTKVFGENFAVVEHLAQWAQR